MTDMEDDKKKIAAMTAVLYYLQAGETTAVLPESRPAVPPPNHKRGDETYAGNSAQHNYHY